MHGAEKKTKSRISGILDIFALNVPTIVQK